MLRTFCDTNVLASERVTESRLNARARMYQFVGTAKTPFERGKGKKNVLLSSKSDKPFHQKVVHWTLCLYLSQTLYDLNLVLIWWHTKHLIFTRGAFMFVPPWKLIQFENIVPKFYAFKTRFIL
mmetsp:Transcript_4085/g.6301  ORF Transcript_4085/g.6301 Transcript_4085/m.6301 type:complete len:124 (+) Transcript_4085:284-655(+)